MSMFGTKRLLVVALALLVCWRGAEAQEPEPAPHIVELIDLLASADASERARAGKELLSSGPVAMGALLDAAGGRNVVVAEEARRVLTSAGPEAIDGIRAAGYFNSYDRPWRRHEASAAVARMGETVIPRILKDFTTADPAGSGFSFAVGVLFDLGDRAVEPLIPLLKHPTQQVRYEAATILAHLANPRSYDALIEGLRSEDEGVRTPSARGLGNIGDHSAAEALLRALSDRGFTTRSAAAGALGRIYEPRFLRPLARVARGDQEIQVRDTASSVLMYYSHDPVGVRIGKRYKPFALSPERQGWIELGFALRVALTGAVLVGLALWLPRRIGKDEDRRWVHVALAVSLAGAMGCVWGRVVDNIWGTVENLLLFGFVPVVAAFGYAVLPVREGERRALRAWVTTVAGFYVGYGVGWLALWGYLGI